MTPLEGALWLAAQGFAVFPADHPGNPYCVGLGRGHDPQTCTDRGKHPCTPFSRAHTTDERQIRRWFERQLRNVAIAVGACQGPDGARLLVVDSDRPGAIEDAAAAQGRRHTPTMRVTTAKGAHDYYWVPASLRLGNGLGALRGRFNGDVRAGNAYVIGPGSVHATGVIYELEDADRPPAAAPSWLLTALQAPVPQPAAPAGHPSALGKRGGALLPLIRFVLDSKEGQRNERLYWAACRAFDNAREKALDTRAVAESLAEAAARIGLSDGEARATITSAYRSRTSR
jgi:hypothetical protein